MSRYQFELSGQAALLLHADDVEWADTLTAWRLDPANAKKKGESSGDDRRPAFTWIGYLYHDGTHVAMPGTNLTSCLRKAGARVPRGRQQTFKELAVSGIFIEQEFMEFYSNGKQVPIKSIHSLLEESDFRQHVATVEKLGFRLFVKRAAVGSAKHVRVRPRFDSWSIRGTLEVTSDQISAETLGMIFDQAGRVGLGDWRPGSPKSPGPFGLFSSKIKKL